MVIDKKLNLDQELEYFPDGGLVFAQNVVVSNDGLTIQNEPAIVNFLTRENFNLVGFVACNEEFVLFSDNNDVIRINKNGTETICETNWKWGGGEVFGTFTYNVNNELIIAISERLSKEQIEQDIKIPLKIINLDRDKYSEEVGESVYTLTPDIPKSNMIDVEYVQGDKIRKGKYNFFIKYFINDEFETGWFPIGVPVFAYDNSLADIPKITAKEDVQALEDDVVLMDNGAIYKLAYEDFYNKDTEFTNDNIKLKLEINEPLFYTHYKIGYLITYNGGSEAKSTPKYLIGNNTIIINSISDTVSIDDLTIGNFNIYNVNTMCNYKNRLYLANYKEENRNSIVDKIYTGNIVVTYDRNENENIPEIGISGPTNVYEGVHDILLDKYKVYNEYEYDYSALKNQWKSKPGRAAVYNFYIHYVYPNGNFTDGIKIGNLNSYRSRLYYSYSVLVDPISGSRTKTPNYIIVNKDTTTDSMLQQYNEGDTVLSTLDNPELKEFLEDNLGVPWWTVEAKYYEKYPERYFELAEDDNGPLNNFINTNGDVLYITPINSKFNVNKLIFEGIQMYPEFVGYFISYEEPEYINIGEGLLAPNKVVREIDENDNIKQSVNGDLFDIAAYYSSKDWRFYYPEFNIIGGKTNIKRLVPSGTHDGFPLETAYTINTNRMRPTTATGYNLIKNSFINNKPSQSVDKAIIVAPDSLNNMGREGFLNVITKEEFARNDGFTAVDSFIGLDTNVNIYLSEDKKLVSLGYIKYAKYDESNPDKIFDYGYEEVPYNYDFYRCYSSIYWFRYGGIIINETEANPIVINDMYVDINYTGEVYAKPDYNNKLAGSYYYTKYGINDLKYYPHIGIVKYWHESHYPLFLKEINQEPQIIFRPNYRISAGGDSGVIYLDREEIYQIQNTVISPKYVNDLYKLDACYYDYTGKLLVNYDKSLISNQMDDYVKTVRRSDVIQSESIINAWRYFRPENYKIITENKGNITNVVGIGNYLFVHCEHSLFVFDITDSLQALDKNVQLLQPDSFEVNYKEIFTADKGYGGLQDFVSWICDEFGYIFYDKSANKIYRFDAGQLKDITEGIEDFIKLVKPEQIWFGNDRPRNRIILNLQADNNDVIISYNFNSGGWVSTHSYISNYKFINIKDKTFIPNVDNDNVNITHYDSTKFNQISLPVGNIANDNSIKSFIDVIFTNPNYNKIRVLDFITYILNKEPNDNFELLQLEIYTNCCYSGVIDISQERKKVSEYKKPYYDFERWNFNYFRNKLDKIENADVFDRLTGKNNNYPEKVQRGYDNALISGKYVVIRFTFKNTTKEVNIKDIHAYFKP